MSEENTVVDEAVEEQVEEQVEEIVEEEKKHHFTDAEFQKMLDKKFAKWSSDRDKKDVENIKKVKEEERKAKLSETEKLKEEKEEAERALRVYRQNDTARKYLEEKKMRLPDAIVRTLIADDDETTKANIDDFVEVYQADIATKVKESLPGGAPQGGRMRNGTKTKEEILNIKDGKLRRSEMLKHPELFESLK